MANELILPSWPVKISATSLEDVCDWADFDAAFLALATGEDLSRPLDRLIQVVAVQNVVTSQLLVGSRERAVGDPDVFAPHGDGRSGECRVQRLAAAEDFAPPCFLHDRPMER